MLPQRDFQFTWWLALVELWRTR